MAFIATTTTADHETWLLLLAERVLFAPAGLEFFFLVFYSAEIYFSLLIACIHLLPPPPPPLFCATQIETQYRYNGHSSREKKNSVKSWWVPGNQGNRWGKSDVLHLSVSTQILLWQLCCSFVLLLTFWSKVIYRGTMNLFYLTDNIVVPYIHFSLCFQNMPISQGLCAEC